jgi:hypothetical protein
VAGKKRKHAFSSRSDLLPLAARIAIAWRGGVCYLRAPIPPAEVHEHAQQSHGTSGSSLRRARSWPTSPAALDTGWRSTVAPHAYSNRRIELFAVSPGARAAGIALFPGPIR